MHNREITHIVKTGSSPNTHLTVQTECSFLSRQSLMKTDCKRPLFETQSL